MESTQRTGENQTKTHGTVNKNLKVKREDSGEHRRRYLEVLERGILTNQCQGPAAKHHNTRPLHVEGGFPKDTRCHTLFGTTCMWEECESDCIRVPTRCVCSFMIKKFFDPLSATESDFVNQHGPRPPSSRQRTTKPTALEQTTHTTGVHGP